MRVTNSITFESKQSLMDNPYKIYTTELDNELNFSFSRSGGPGGQHVNKVNTKVELRFAIVDSLVLTEEEKAILLEKLAKQINQEGELIVIAQETRSQLKNKSKAIEKFYDIINKALKPKKKRKPTTISKAAKEKRLKQKKELSEKKERRRF
jgi:ribosome-associated protein